MAGDKVVAVRLVALTSAYRTSMRQAAAETVGFERTVGRSTMRAGASLTRFAGPAALAGVALAFGATANAAIDYERAFAGVRKTLDASEEQYAAISEALLDLSSETGMAATELAAVAEAAGQLGVEADRIAEFTETMAMLSTAAADLSADEAAVSIARFAEITGMHEGQVDNFASALVELGNNFAATEGEILELGMRLAGAGTQFGLTEADILGLAAGMKSVGLSAEAGGTALSRVMVDIADAAARGTDELPLFAEVAGMTTEQFAAMVDLDPREALLRFVEGLDQIGESGGNVFEVLDELGLSDVRVRDALLRSAGASDTLRAAFDASGEAIASTDALLEEFAKRQDTNAAKIDRVGTAWNNLMVRIGESGPADIVGSGAEFLADTLEDAAKTSEEVSEAASDWKAAQRDWYDAAAGDEEAIGRLATAREGTDRWAQSTVDAAVAAEEARLRGQGLREQYALLDSTIQPLTVNTEDYADALLLVSERQNNALDPVWGLVDAWRDYEEAVEDAEEEERESGEVSEETARKKVEAFLRVRAAAAIGEGAWKRYKSELMGMLAAGDLTEAEFEVLIGLIDEINAGLASLPAEKRVRITLELAGVDLNTFRQHLIGAGPSGSPAPSSTTNTTTNNFTVNSTGGSATPVQHLRRLAEQVT